jgi:hypothetical protein
MGQGTAFMSSWISRVSHVKMVSSRTLHVEHVSDVVDVTDDDQTGRLRPSPPPRRHVSHAIRCYLACLASSLDITPFYGPEGPSPTL